MVEGSSTAYLAVAGGFALPPFMGSLSTYARAGVGGFEGRKLAAGDALPLAREQAPPGDEKQARPALRLWQRADPHRLGTAGRLFQRRGPPHLHRVRLSRLQGGRSHGHPLRGPDDRARQRRQGGADIISDGIGPGAIQVPGAGLPIVLLADRQTVGGYPKIATVASVDLPRLGRLLPGQTVRFAPVTVEEAETAAPRAGGADRSAPSPSFKAARPPGGIDLVRLYEENLIDGIVYEPDHASR